MAVAERSTQTPLYEEVVQDYAHGGFMLVAGTLIIVGTPLMIITILRAHPLVDVPRLVLFALLAVLLLPAPWLAYFCIYPMRVSVDEHGLTLRSGITNALRKRTILFSSITAIRRSRYTTLKYEQHDRPIDSVDGAQLWRMGGKQVLEIEAQDSLRIIILSSRADQLASLLHEMTHVPVEDCR